MIDFLSPFYLWIKALHIISVISWMAALLYLPRLFVYHSLTKDEDRATSELLSLMEYRLARFIMRPAMISTWLFGILLILTPGVVDYSVFSWFYVKLLCVILLTISHGWLVKRVKDFENGQNKYTSKTYRIVNEVPTLLMIIIVILVIVKPF